MSYLDSMARTLGGDIASRAKMQIVCPGPGHSARDRSLSVFVDPGSPDGFRVHPHSPRDDWRECRDYVRDRLGLPSFQSRTVGPRTATPPRSTPANTNVPAEKNGPTTALALAIWQEAQP